LNNISSIFLTIKWHRLAVPLKIKSNFWQLFRLNYIAVFYSSFLPGQASGELIKGIKMSHSEESKQTVWIPIFIDKITNVLIVFIIGFVAVLFDSTLRQDKYILGIVSLSTLLLSIITIILFSENTEKIVSALKEILISIMKKFNLKTDLIKSLSLNYFEKYKKHDFLMIETLLWSILIKLPHIFAFHLLALSLNIDLNIAQSAWFFAILSIAVIIPISFSGLGIREGTSIFSLSKLGVDSASALSLSLLVFLNGLIVAIIGGIIELFYGHKLGKKST
jgi:uncharacterized protein (TIRG00374 family)